MAKLVSKFDNKEDEDWWNRIDRRTREHIVKNLNTVHVPVKVTDMMPTDTSNRGPYAVMWPAGFPHAARSTTRTLRMTMAITLDPQIDEKERARSIIWMRALTKRDWDTLKLKRYNYSFATGKTHKCPADVESEIFPFFEDMYVDNEDDFMPLFKNGMPK